MENIYIYIPLFHIWKTKWTGASGAAGLRARPRAIGSFPTQSLISLAPLGPPSPQVSVVLFHPVPAFIAVLPVLFGLNELSVVPAEESHLSKKEGKENVRFLRGVSVHRSGQDERSCIIFINSSSGVVILFSFFFKINKIKLYTQVMRNCGRPLADTITGRSYQQMSAEHVASVE